MRVRPCQCSWLKRRQAEDASSSHQHLSHALVSGEPPFPISPGSASDRHSRGSKIHFHCQLNGKEAEVVSQDRLRFDPWRVRDYGILFPAWTGFPQSSFQDDLRVDTLMVLQPDGAQKHEKHKYYNKNLRQKTEVCGILISIIL